MKEFIISGVTKLGADLDVKVRAKDIELADMIASVYFEFCAILGAK